MKTLHLILKKKWFDMILSGEKKEEYRDQKQYWKNRLIKDGYWFTQTCKQFDTITFRNGYSKDAPAMIVQCKGISVKEQGNKNWGFEGRCFVIELGKIISTKNIT